MAAMKDMVGIEVGMAGLAVMDMAGIMDIVGINSIR
jgi:ribosomal protein S5